MKFRLAFIILFFTSLYSLAIFNIYTLQIKKGEYYSARASSQSRLAGFLEPLRGNIYFTDKYGNAVPAAITKAYPVLYAVPKEIADPAATADVLASVINMDRDDLLELLSKSNDPYELLARRATPEQVSGLRNLNLQGLYIDEENGRFYPYQNLASQVLGFISPTAKDDTLIGRYGVELQYQNRLAGEEGRLDGDRTIRPTAGENIYLTIDPNVQARAEEILKALIDKYDAEQGSVIVQEPKTGKILALGGFPNFDPNQYASYPLADFLNPIIQGVYEPGSVMKVVTMAAGLDSNKLAPETTFYDSGSLTLDGRTIKNWDLKAHGRVTMTEVIEQSINTGAAYAQRLIGNDLFYNYLVKFGFGEPTGIALPGELGGNINNLKSSFREINFATAAFGQGVSVTPLQMINAVSAIANGGVLMRPYLNSRDEQPKEIRRVISPMAARQITDMMVSAVRKATIAQIPKFSIAGKTGTAQIPDFKRGGYSDQYIHTYIGFAPAFDPKFTVLLRIDKPYGAPLAGLTVVPAFRELAEFLINYYNLPPDILEPNANG